MLQIGESTKAAAADRLRAMPKRAAHRRDEAAKENAAAREGSGAKPA